MGMSKQQMIDKFGIAYYEEYKRIHRERYRNDKKYHNKHLKDVKANYMKNPDIREKRNEYAKEWNKKRYCCEPLCNIENYALAEADGFNGWVIHHRYELTDNDEILCTHSELKAVGLYENRPASELIWMRVEEHTRRHSRAYHKKKKQLKCGK